MTSTTDHDAIGGFDAGRRGNRLPPLTPEQEERAAELRVKVQEANAAFDRLPLVEQAMHRMDQKRSFVRGECGRDDPLLKEPEYVVLAAYRDLLKATPDPIPQPGGNAPPAPAQSAGAAADSEDDVILYAKDWWNHERRSVSPVASRGDMEALADIFARRGAQPHNPAAPSPDQAEAFARGDWRVGQHYGIHVYQGDRPVATFMEAADAKRAVDAVNAAPVLDRARLAGQGEGDSWRPIATAPLDDGILYFTKLKHGNEYGIACFNEELGEWFCEASGADVHPQFWRPLPAPPSADAPPAPASRATSAPAQDASPARVTEAEVEEFVLFVGWENVPELREKARAFLTKAAARARRTPDAGQEVGR